MKNKFKKLVATVAAVAVALTAVVVTDVTPASAATPEYDTLYISDSVETATAGEEKPYNFTVSKTGNVYFTVIVPEKVEYTVTMYNSSGAVLQTSGNPYTITVDNQYWDYDDQLGYIFDDPWGPLPNGDYTYGITFASDAQYALMIQEEKASAKISDPKATVTAGFTKKLSVSGAKVKKWSSNKKEVATVDSKGKVTGKKAGKATISAKCENGQTVKCVVKVKANTYKRTKPSLNDVTPGRWGQVAYGASFDSKGNLVIKTRILNNTNGRLTEIRNLKITVKNGSGKTVATYSAKKQSISVPAYSTKDGVTYTISKSKIKKAIDLRNAKIECDGEGYGY